MLISLRLAQHQDLVAIETLVRRIWQVHYVPMIGQGQVDYMLSNFYAAEALSKQIDEGQVFRLVVQNEIIIGCIAITPKGEGHYFLNKFYIDNTEQSKGIGEEALKQTLALYPDLKTLSLQVNKHNYKAINFYFKVGFKIEKLFVLDIGGGYVMDDFLMVSSPF